MPYDKSQLFYDDSTLTEDGVSTEIQVGPGTYDVDLIVKEIDANESAIFKVQESADGSTYQDLATFPTISAVGRYHRRVKTHLEWLQIAHDVDVSIKVTGGLVHGEDGGVDQS